jgi:hypothetical protein
VGNKYLDRSIAALASCATAALRSRVTVFFGRKNIQKRSFDDECARLIPLRMDAA